VEKSGQEATLLKKVVRERNPGGRKKEFLEEKVPSRRKNWEARGREK